MLRSKVHISVVCVYIALSIDLIEMGLIEKCIIYNQNIKNKIKLLYCALYFM